MTASLANCFIHRQRGSTTVETTLSLGIVCLIVTSGLSIIYLSFANVWLERASYEGVICLSTVSPTRICEDRLRLEAQSALPVGSVSDVHMERSHSKASVHLRFNIFGKDVLEHRDARKLPLSLGQANGI